MTDKGQIVGQATIPAQVGKATVESGRKWVGQQIPYKNFAGMHEPLDAAAAAFVSNHRERFRSRMASSMEHWAVNWSAAIGEATWHEHEDDVHVPETKKAIDAKVARVEEALLEFDPIFRVEGTKGQLSRWKAQVIGSYTMRLMELANFQDYFQPVARDAELCNIAAIKIIWDQQIGLQVDREITKKWKPDGKTFEWHDVRRMRESIVRSGPRYHLVDPFWFFYDLDAGRPEDCEFIGDESEVFIHELEQKARLGYFPKEQVKKVKDRKKATDSVADGSTINNELPDMYRQARSVALGPDFVKDSRGEHNAQKCRLIECWGFFDFGEGFDGVVDPLGKRIRGTKRVVITIANGVCVRFMLNPYDKQFVPYAIARINQNGHEMVAPSQFDHVVQLNAQYDLVHSNILRMLSLSVAPIIITTNDTDMPDTLLGVLPGSKLNCTGQWDIVKMPDVQAQSIAYFHSYFRNEIEETSGAKRMVESPSETATKTLHDSKEQQLLIRPSVRANAELWRQVALKTYWMSGQFASDTERFAVAGKASTVLGTSAEITPDILQEDVDFKFIGLQSLHTYGQRLAGLTQFLNAAGPLIASGALPNVNAEALFRSYYELSVGRADVHEIFSKAIPPWDTMPQEEENVMILAGTSVPISERDDDRDHIEKTLPIAADKTLPAQIRKVAFGHIAQHLAQQQRKEAEAAAQQREANQKAMLAAPQGGKPGEDRAPVDGGMPAQQKGVTPGPTQERTVSRTGRKGSGVSQAQKSA